VPAIVEAVADMSIPDFVRAERGAVARMHNRFPRRENCLVPVLEIDSSDHAATFLSNFGKQIFLKRLYS
jgi:hypothetical protein